MTKWRTTICNQGLLTFLKAKACRTIVYIQNCNPHQIIDNMTLEEAFTSIKLEVNHFRIFRCLVYIHMRKDKDPS